MRKLSNTDVLTQILDWAAVTAASGSCSRQSLICSEVSVEQLSSLANLRARLAGSLFRAAGVVALQLEAIPR